MTTKVLLVKLVLLLCALPAIVNGQSAKHVVIISIDGFRPDFYREQKWGAVHLQQMAKRGVSADGVNSIFPSLTFPNHTSIITGVRSARHGIFHNSPFTPHGSSDWYWYEKDILVETLWDVVEQNGGTTVSVNWPVSVGAPVDVNIPIVKARGQTQLEVTSKYTVPEGLMEEIQRYATGKLDSINFNTNEDLMIMDQNVGRIAGYLIRKYKPTLTTVRLSGVDHFEHLQGREGDLVVRAVAGADNAIGHIIESLQRAGIADSAAVIVTGDHGFVDVHSSFSPNFLLKRAGMLDTQGGDWLAKFKPAGGSAFLYLRDPSDQMQLKEIKALLSGLKEYQEGKFRFLERRQLDAAGSDPRATLALTAMPGYSFVGTSTGPFVKSVARGTHGYFPDFKEIQTGFVAFGAGLKKGHELPEMETIDIAPLVAALLGVTLHDVEGKLHHRLLAEYSRGLH